MNNSNQNNQNTQPQADAAPTTEKKLGRVSAAGAAFLIGAGALTLAVPEGNAPSPAETRISQVGNTQANNDAPRELPGTKFDELSGTSLTLRPNPRRQAPVQEQAVDTPAHNEQSESTQPNEPANKPEKEDKHMINWNDDAINPQTTEVPTTTEPAPPIVEVTNGPLPAPENPDPMNQ